MKRIYMWVLLAGFLAACGKPSGDATSVQTPPQDAVDFGLSLDENTHDAYAAFISKHPGSRYVDLAIELYTEASILGRSAAKATVENARQAIDADTLRTAND